MTPATIYLTCNGLFVARFRAAARAVGSLEVRTCAYATVRRELAGEAA